MTEFRKKYHQEILDTHAKKIARLLFREGDVDEDIINISSYQLNFFQKLALRRGLDFPVPKHVSAMDVKASFEKAFWRLEPHIPEHLRDLATST